MKKSKILLLIDSIINLFLGIILIAFSEAVVQFFGLPNTDQRFYPNVLGAVLVGIGIALLIQYYTKTESAGLGLQGAIAINLSGGLVLLLWLVFGKMDIPIKGKIILWCLAMVLIIISSLELAISVKTKKQRNIE